MKHTVVMTGATRGIGRVAAERILAEDKDAHLLVLARGESGAELARDLQRRGHNVAHIEADLSSLASTRTAAATLRDNLTHGQLPPVKGFVGNAGIQYPNDTTEGPEGFEATFALNVMANHVLISALTDLFDPPARIVITSSDTHFGDFKHNLGLVPAPNWQAPETLARINAFPSPASVAAGRTAYSTSKLAVIYLVHEYARRLPAGVDIVSYNPGFVPNTGLARNADPLSRFVVRRILPALAVTPVATSRRAAGQYLADVVLGKIDAASGSYVDRGKVIRSSDESYDPAREAQLWQALERLTAAV
ncbi:SDR family NAD(P)-dependent oxidoreductase [Mycobacterium kubicae]|uniref:SDR family NAD(P)-dependent oxidoreductase n=1 Tax=Mycobacterium kubicae TaxID=120959 RepID=UPI001640B00C|nr:SDR family NAD(P)-dependent oxidoreductase [Mycobacterium kubicae]QNI07354.1 SDR family NAD(P)-dependent oxidoreductase [Mycobacterium kubicae]